MRLWLPPARPKGTLGLRLIVVELPGVFSGTPVPEPSRSATRGNARPLVIAALAVVGCCGVEPRSTSSLGSAGSVADGCNVSPPERTGGDSGALLSGLDDGRLPPAAGVPGTDGVRVPTGKDSEESRCASRGFAPPRLLLYGEYFALLSRGSGGELIPRCKRSSLSSSTLFFFL